MAEATVASSGNDLNSGPFEEKSFDLTLFYVVTAYSLFSVLIPRIVALVSIFLLLFYVNIFFHTSLERE